jgi:hypothetical protein
MAKRQRVDSATAAVAIFAGAQREIAPPAHVMLGDGDWPYWHSVVTEFAKSEWTDHQLEVAAQLAKAMADLETERNALRLEGYVLDISGKAVANPRHGVARDLTNSVMSLRRNLSLHARAQGGEARDVGKRRDMALDIEAQAGEATSLLN